MKNEFIGMLFAARDYAHKRHLRVTGRGSYAAHVALQEFYEGLVDLADELAETCQGRHGIMKEIPTMNLDSEAEPVATIKATLRWLEDNRRETFGDDSVLQNLVDGIAGLHLRTIYKLENLQ